MLEYTGMTLHTHRILLIDDLHHNGDCAGMKSRRSFELSWPHLDASLRE